MPAFEDLYDETPDGVILRLLVQPGAGDTRAVGRHGNALKMRVAAVPERGRANDEVVRFLAELFETKKAEVQLKSGDTSRNKTVLLKGFDAETVERRLGVVIVKGGRRRK